MKICFVSPGVYYSEELRYHQQGSESVILGISKYMARCGHEVIITGRFGENMENLKNIEFKDINSPSLKDKPIQEVGSYLIYSKYTAKEISKEDIDVLSLNERFSAYFPSKLGTPKVFTTHNPDAMDFYKKFAVKINKINYIFFDIKQRIEESVMRNSDKIIALNDYIHQYLSHKRFNNVITIPDAIDVKKYTDKGDDNFILFAGRLEPVKGIEFLIHAFSLLNPDLDMELLIIGSGNDQPRLEKIARSKDISHKIRFIPMLNKSALREYLSKCTVFVLPSLFETMGTVLLEAMASGKPVIASDIPGPNNIIENGYNGYLFEKGNVKELSKSLELLIRNENLRKETGLAALKTVTKHYTYEKVALDYLKVFNQIVV